MSQKNVEVVRRFYEAGQRSIETYWKDPREGIAAVEARLVDEPETQGVLRFLHPDVEINTRGLALYGGPARGHLDWLKVWDELLAASKSLSFELRGIEDLGGGEVLMEAEMMVTWKASGIEQRESGCWLMTLRNGLIVRVDSYRNRTEVLEAVGLSEQDAHPDS